MCSSSLALYSRVVCSLPLRLAKRRRRRRGGKPQTPNARGTRPGARPRSSAQQRVPPYIATLQAAPRASSTRRRRGRRLPLDFKRAPHLPERDGDARRADGGDAVLHEVGAMAGEREEAPDGQAQ